MFCTIKEPDTFPSTYARDFVQFSINAKSHLTRGADAFALTNEERERFIDVNAIKKIPWDKQLEIIKELYARRMKTTYNLSFGEKNKSNDKSESSVEDMLLDQAEKLFSIKSKKVLEPPPTSRRVMGYCRPTNYYIGLSEYQDRYSRYGYQRLNVIRDTRIKRHLPMCDQFKLK